MSIGNATIPAFGFEWQRKGSLKVRKVPILPHYPFLTEIKIIHFQTKHKMGFYLVNVQMFKQADLKL